MRELKPKKCMMPSCDKETFDKKAFFCREHTRVFESFVSTAKKMQYLPQQVRRCLWQKLLVVRKNSIKKVRMINKELGEIK